MVVAGWKSVNLVLMVGLLLGTAYGQNSQQVSEVNEQKLLELLQETNFGFEIEIQTTFQEKEDDDLFSTIDEPSEFEFLETPNPEKQLQFFEKTTIPESILKFADFVQQYKPQQTGDVVSFETHLDVWITQQTCQKDFPNFGRVKFNAVGTIRISFEDGREKYCTGTLIDQKTVITSAECYQENAKIYQFQPSWADDNVWLPFQEQPYISDNYVHENGTSNFALFFLKNSQDKAAPRIGYEIAVTQTQQCYITLLGWKNSILQNGYKMVTCPNLPEVEDQLGIKSESCQEISCKLDNMGFQTGSPIVLTCPTPIKHTVIGVLYMRNEEDLAETNFPGPKTIAYPYMFDLEDYQDIKERVRKGTSP